MAFGVAAVIIVLVWSTEIWFGHLDYIWCQQALWQNWFAYGRQNKRLKLSAFHSILDKNKLKRILSFLNIVIYNMLLHYFITIPHETNNIKLGVLILAILAIIPNAIFAFQFVDKS